MIQTEDCLFLSPERTPRHFLTLSGVSTYNVTPIGKGKRDLFASPQRGNSLETSPESPMLWSSPDGSDFMKRGRPKANVISHLMTHGSTADSPIRCLVCSRIFPREKSLSAHMRTHTGEKPYRCDYPKCTKAFCQSGQLKTHQRLHTGEQPFICSILGCKYRFMHANRHCPIHPDAALTRDEENMPIPALSDVNTTPVVRNWLKKYLYQRQDRTPYKQVDSDSYLPIKRSLNLTVETLSEQQIVDDMPNDSQLNNSNSRKILFVSDQVYKSLPIKKRQKFDIMKEGHVGDNEDRLNGALALIQLAKGSLANNRN